MFAFRNSSETRLCFSVASMNVYISMLCWLLVSCLPIVGQAETTITTKIAVLDFELNDLTLAPKQPAEIKRTASLKGLLEQSLKQKNITLVFIPQQRQQQENKGHGYLFEHPELVAQLGAEVSADYVVSGRLHKPSFLFAYLMNKLIAVESGRVVKEFVTETKGNAPKLTAKAVESLAEKLGDYLSTIDANATNTKNTVSDSDTVLNNSLRFPTHTIVSDKLFDDVIEDLLLAIGGHNFRLTEHAKIGDAIADREGVVFPRVTVLHFCNLNYAQQLLQLAPEMALRMPCRISVQQTDDGAIMIKVILLPAEQDDTELAAFAQTINTILVDIVAEGAS